MQDHKKNILHQAAAYGKEMVLKDDALVLIVSNVSGLWSGQ